MRIKMDAIANERAERRAKEVAQQAIIKSYKMLTKAGVNGTKAVQMIAEEYETSPDVVKRIIQSV